MPQTTAQATAGGRGGGGGGGIRPLTESEMMTIDILCDPDMMRQIEQSDEDVRAGRVVPWKPGGACCGTSASASSASSASSSTASSAAGDGDGGSSTGKAGEEEEACGRLRRLLPDVQRHPARLVGDAIDVLGRAQDNIRGKTPRRAIVKARNILIGMLDGGGPRCTGNTAAAPRGGGGKKRHGQNQQKQRQKQGQKQKQKQNRRPAK